MEATQFSWRPLGRLFVDKGLLREEDLEHALAQQAETGGRLGEKLVELGYVSSTALARLLAEQYGVELKQGSEPEPTTLQVVPEPQPLAGLEEQWAKLAAAEAQVAELEAVIEAMPARPAERDAQIAELVEQVAQLSAGRKKRRAS